MSKFSRCFVSIAGISAISVSGFAYATNGDAMIGQGAEARSMGGVGIAKSFGAASGLANPAMINSVKKMEITGAITAFMPSVDVASNAAANAATTSVVPVSSDTSTADLSFIPEVAFGHRVNERVVYGVSVAGTAGMGVDYSDVAFGTATDNGAFNMKTNLQLLKVALPVSYENSGLTVGLSPILQYGTLEMSHQRNDSQADPNSFSVLESPKASDTSIGFEVGAAYDLTKLGINGLKVGAVYKSKLGMEYKDTIGKSVEAFGGALTGVSSGDNLDQPAEYGVGLAYSIGANTVALDYSHLAWTDATGYKDFGWEDQNVFAVGYEYATKRWALRAGYNYGKNPIAEQDGNTYAGAVQNFFNLAGFPGVVESHFTFGGGYSFSDALSLDVAVVYASEVSLTYNTTGMTQAFANDPRLTAANTGAQASTVDVTHSQLGFSAGMSYTF